MGRGRRARGHPLPHDFWDLRHSPFLLPLRGWIILPTRSHGLRRGLYSCAASRLEFTYSLPLPGLVRLGFLL
jgi:hypothetical protein